MPNTAAVLPPQLMTVDEFLAWPGDGTGTRYELVEGEPRAMAFTTDVHGTIHASLITEIRNHLRATRPGCRVVDAPGIRPRLRADWNFRIPELGVTCTSSRPGQREVQDAILLAEVLSPSNRQDTWNNIALYSTVPSVQEILIVDSEVVKVEILRRLPDGSWPLQPETVIGTASSVDLQSIGLTLPLSEIYADTYLLIAGA